MIRRLLILSAAALVLQLIPSRAAAQEHAYFVTYDHYLEEPGNLEIGLSSTSGLPRNGESPYHAPWLEIEYGVSGWWTTEMYLEGVTTHRDGSGFTGVRWENRFRPLKSEHAINPVLYFEYERTNEASRIQKEIVGSGSLDFQPISWLRSETMHELEAKLILSSAVRGFNLSENFIAEKNLSEDEGVEFGYSLGISRPLAALASGTPCRFCAENFVAGVEAFGGLGSTLEFGRAGQRHYIAPVLAWRIADRATIKASVAAGLTPASDRLLVRIGYIYEFSTRGRK
ncbi:MAG TPA: hypothetical protein VN628_00030 [Vicinamibacterales bacterium]|nr:hypothetical protein [Vicinamibacterales bacterium]